MACPSPGERRRLQAESRRWHAGAGAARRTELAPPSAEATARSAPRACKPPA
ncbi:hypothetical protein Pyn_24919 [Prunus yedoensis var. nudiflora]|uniref:Uncharacterized protein n=1 Tax=Prunus yedoensis var. nudiflora TaxID=2094558 RepID=A0A314XLA8_PRUYE|nr:hypothetical protein Pyn_24919 [Prunus yedoensis var. nudiflora]